ncbi:MAG TPA: DUF6034 family protein [Clostridia bacterium]|nr:DUF6034 family protein [Clostridia bacterium]
MRKIIAAVICLSILFSGCQATPETPPVIYQGNDYLGENPSKETAKLDAADHLDYSVDMNGLEINFSADVFIPKIKFYSVTEIEKAVFSKDDITRYINYFAPKNAVLYQTNDLTKRQVAALIVGLEEAGPDQIDQDLAESVISDLNALYETAPNEVNENNASFSLNDVGIGEYFSAYAFINDDTYCHFGGALNGNSFSYNRNSYTVPTPQSIFSESDPELSDYNGKFPITEDAAIRIAKQVLIDLGIDNMEVSYAEKACAYHYFKAHSVESKGWQVVFTRNSNGLPSIYLDGASLWNTSESPALGSPWDQEVIFVTVDGEGVYSFDWRGAGKQKKVLVENADLLPLEDILKRAEKQLMYQHLPQNNEKADFSITVKKISLDSALVNVANEANIGRMIPVWDFYYDIVYKESESSSADSYVLTLNAIDGRYIEPRITKTTIEQVSTGD